MRRQWIGEDFKPRERRRIKKKPPGQFAGSAIRIGKLPDTNIVVPPSYPASSGPIWYWVHIETAGTLVMDTSTSTNQALDTVIGLYGVRGNYIWDADQGSVNDLTSLSRAVAPGVYFICVGLYGMNFGGNFNVTGGHNPGGIRLNITFTP